MLVPENGDLFLIIITANNITNYVCVQYQYAHARRRIQCVRQQQHSVIIDGSAVR